MNLEQFKVIGEDGEHYHLSHPSGQKMSVAKALLSGPAKKAIEKMCSGGEVKGYDEGGTIPASLQANPVDAPAADIAAVPTAITPDPNQAAAPAAAPETAPAISPPDPLITHGTDTDALLGQEQSQIADLAKAQIGEAGESAKAYKDYNDKIAKMQTPEELVNAYKGKDDALMQSYLDHKINPNYFVSHMSTPSKVAAGISMIFGGLGQGLIGGKNPGMEWLQNSINQDIESQKAEQGKSYNLWRMNRDAMGDDMRANIATQNQMWTGVQAKIAQAAAQAQAPIAKFRAQQSINDIERQKIQNRQTLGLLTQGMTGSGGSGFSQADPSQLVQQMVPKELQPQVYKEIGAAQNTVRMGDTIKDAFEQAAKENTVMRTGAGFVRTPASVYALHQAMQPTFSDLEGTVRQAAMDNTFKNVTPAPGDSEHTIETKRNALAQYLRSKDAAPTAKGNGIDLSHFTTTSANPMARMNSEDRQAVNWAQANPSDPRAEAILKKNGLNGR